MADSRRSVDSDIERVIRHPRASARLRRDRVAERFPDAYLQRVFRLGWHEWADQPDRVRMLADALDVSRALRPGAFLLRGISAVRSADWLAAADAFLALGIDRSLALMPFDTVHALLVAHADEADTAIRALGADGYQRFLPSEVVSLAEWALASRRPGLAEHVLSRWEAAADAQAIASVARDTAWIRSRMPSPTPARGAGATAAADGPRLAVLDYRHGVRGISSINIGDHVQTIAALGHVLRLDGVSITSDDPALGAALDELRAGLLPERRVEASGSLRVSIAQRDFSMYDSVEPDTWLLAYGWYMWPLFDETFAFPFHENYRPLFFSFHCNDERLLSPEAVDYLRDNGPVGCRDRHTVGLLRSRGVRAFFSGCVTSTVDTLLGHRTAVSDRAPVGYVDPLETSAVAGEGARFFDQARPGLLDESIAQNLLEARDLLVQYRDDVTRIETSRLHCYLPSRSMRVPVDFNPPDRDDIRFGGLSPLDEEGFRAMQDRFLALVSPVVAEIAQGASVDEVRVLWRALTDPLCELEIGDELSLEVQSAL